MRRLSTKAKKSKAEQSSSESTGTEEEKVTAGNGNEVSGNESGSEDKPSPKKKSKRGKKNDASQKANEDGIADEGSEKRKRRSTGAAKSDDNDEEAAEEYEVEKVVDSKVVRGETHYKIRWKGFSAENDTWEPEADLNCPELIQEFLNSQPEGGKGKNTKNKKRGGKSSGAEPKSKKKKDSEETAEVDNEEEDEEEDEEKVYEVEKVVEVHFKKNGKREFLIRWKGFSSNDDTWEPEENLSCPDLIEKFMAKVDKARNVSVRELRANPQHTDRFTLNMTMQGRRLSRRHVTKGRITYHGAE